MFDQLLDDKDLDLPPELMCIVSRRRARIIAMAAASRPTTANLDRADAPADPLLAR